jgi:hypothetical protein
MSDNGLPPPSVGDELRIFTVVVKEPDGSEVVVI